MNNTLSTSIVFLFLIFASPQSYCESKSDNDYGQTENKAIKVWGLANSGPGSERAYLQMLRSPKGEKINFRRIGSCCHIDTPSAPFAMLDMYEIVYEGIDKPVVIYLNMYDEPSGALLAPAGFKLIDKQ